RGRAVPLTSAGSDLAGADSGSDDFQPRDAQLDSDSAEAQHSVAGHRLGGTTVRRSAHRNLVDAGGRLDRLPGSHAIQRHALCQGAAAARRSGGKRPAFALTLRGRRDSSATMARRRLSPCATATWICVTAAKAANPNSSEIATLSIGFDLPARSPLALPKRVEEQMFLLRSMFSICSDVSSRWLELA